MKRSFICSNVKYCDVARFSLCWLMNALRSRHYRSLLDEETRCSLHTYFCILSVENPDADLEVIAALNSSIACNVCVRMALRGLAPSVAKGNLGSMELSDE